MSKYQIIDSDELRAEWPLPEPSDDGDKHERGTVVVIGGAAATPGAIMLAGLAGLRVGAGRLSMATVRTNASSLAVAVPESAVAGLPTTPAGAIAAAAAEQCCDLVEDADAVLLGPGMDGPQDTRQLVDAVLSRLPADAAVVLDALALTCGIAASEQLAKVSARAVITPNHDEACWLLDDNTATQDTTIARALADKLGVITVAGAAVASPDGRCYRIPGGNVGLATSGSGDVLAGIIAGLAARGADPLQAALWGVALHSGAGDRLVDRIGQVGYLARELLDELPLMLSETH